MENVKMSWTSPKSLSLNAKIGDVVEYVELPV